MSFSKGRLFYEKIYGQVEKPDGKSYKSDKLSKMKCGKSNKPDVSPNHFLRTD